jgi:hypothetical protein
VTGALAVQAAADGVLALGRSLGGRVVAGLAAALQVWLAGAGIVRAVLERYRA